MSEKKTKGFDDLVYDTYEAYVAVEETIDLHNKKIATLREKIAETANGSEERMNLEIERNKLNSEMYIKLENQRREFEKRLRELSNFFGKVRRQISGYQNSFIGADVDFIVEQAQRNYRQWEEEQND